MKFKLNSRNSIKKEERISAFRLHIIELSDVNDKAEQ